MKTNNKRTLLPKSIHIRRKTPLPRAKQIVGMKCPQCNCVVALFDERKCEKLCSECGFVISEPNLVGVSYEQVSSQSLHSSLLTKDEKKLLHIPNHFNDRKERRYMDYKHIVDTVKVDLCLTRVDIQDILLIIRRVDSLKQLHSRLPYETIIVGICRYVLKKRKVLPVLVRYTNQAYLLYELNKHDYEIIEKNIKKLEKETKI